MTTSTELTEHMRKTLLQIGYGVTGTSDGFRDEDDERVDMRSAQALYDRGLIGYNTTGGAPMMGVLKLTPEGWELFEKIEEEEYDRKRNYR